MIKKFDIKKLLKRKEISIPLGFIAAGLIATVSWLVFTYGTVRTENAKIDGDIIYISSDTAGFVAKLPKSEFNEVSIGETVAEINPLLGTAERLKGSENLSAFSTLAGMKKEIENLSDKLVLAEKNYARKKALFETGGVPRQELDAEATSLSILRAQVDSARDLYDMAKQHPCGDRGRYPLHPAEISHQRAVREEACRPGGDRHGRAAGLRARRSE